MQKYTFSTNITIAQQESEYWGYKKASNRLRHEAATIRIWFHLKRRYNVVSVESI